MTEATVTITADTKTIQRILSILEESYVHGDGVISDRLLREFVRSLSENCRQVVETVSGSSRQGDSIKRSALLQGVIFEDDAQLTGVVGAIGKRWAQFIDQPNPFVGYRRATDNEPSYKIDQELAERLTLELVREADEWRQQLRTPAS